MKYFHQVPLCSKKQKKCVDNILVDINNPKCLPPCSGLILTSFSKYKEDKNLPSLISDEVNEYNRHLKWSPIPSELKGSQF